MLQVSSINRVLRNLAAQKEQQIAVSNNSNSNPSTTSISNVNGNVNGGGVGGGSSAVGGASNGTTNDQIQTATPLNSSESGGASNSGEGSEQESIYEKLRLLNTQHASALDSSTTSGSSNHGQLITSVTSHFSPHPHSHSNHSLHTRSAHQNHHQQSWPPRHYSPGSWYSAPLNGSEIPASPGVINGTGYGTTNIAQVPTRSSDHPLSPPADLINIGGAVHLTNCSVATEDVMLKKGEFKYNQSWTLIQLMYAQVVHAIQSRSQTMQGPPHTDSGT